MSENFQRAFKIIIEAEGGYVNDPKDPGGETKYGISKRSYPDLDIKSLTLDDAQKIYYRDYWIPCRCDFFCYGISLCLFDTAVTSGVSRSIKFLQEASGTLTVDGILGQRTIKVINSSSAWSIITRFCDIREKYLQSLVNFKFYGKGWMKRSKNIRVLAISSLSELDVRDKPK